MKHHLTAILLLSATIPAMAKQPQKGYRGFVDWSNDIRTPSYIYFGKVTEFYTGVSTSHGYQFNENYFLGAGLAMQRDVNWGNSWLVPLFIEARTDRKWGKYTPFGDLRIGCDLEGIDTGVGFYLSPSVGYRFNWGRKVGINVSVGWTFTTKKYDVYHLIIDPDSGYWDAENTGNKMTYTENHFSFRIGFDF